MLFLFDILGRSGSSFLAWLGTTGPGFIVGNILAVVLTLVVTHFVRNAAGDMKEIAAKDLKIGLIVYAIVFGTLFVPIFAYHLFIKVPSEIRMQADSVTVPQRSYSPAVPPFWITKSPPEYQHKAEIHLIFKDSPLFTRERKAHITAVIDSFYRYLRGVGFVIPTDPPPLGTRPGGAISSAGIIPGSIYDAQLRLPEDRIDDPNLIRALYAQWVFQYVIFGDVVLQLFSSDLVMTFDCYYQSSFVNRNLCDYNWRDGEWIRALWDIRQVEGKEFADKALLYTIKAWDAPTTNPKDFTDLFAARFIKGIGILDNDFKHIESASKILAKHSL